MAQKTLQACLSGRPKQQDARAAHVWADYWGPRIAADPKAISDLLGQLDSEGDLPDDLMTLFANVLDSMRMNRENREAGAEAAFAVVEAWAQATSPSLEGAQKMVLCQAFVRVGLEPPEPLRLAADDTEGLGDGTMPDVSALLRELIPDDVAGYPAYMILREAVSAMPTGAAALLVQQMIIDGAPEDVALGRYCLLDPMRDMRLAAAEGVAERAQAGGVDAGQLSDLVRLRKWMPDDPARTTLDRAIKEALRREASGGAVPRAWTLHRLLSSLPDGTGSQSIVASVSRGREKRIATLLLKAGHGIKDSYWFPCASASEQRQMLAQIEGEVPLHEISADYLPAALAQALRENLSIGGPPAAGFLDVSQMLGLPDLAALEDGATTALDIADPDQQLAALSVTKRGRLIGQSLAWVQIFEISDSWFISDAPLSEALSTAKTERQAEKAVWQILEQRRADWAGLFARCAAILRGADDHDWLTFAAVVQGIETGRPLKKIPIFEMIVATSLDAAEDASLGALDPEPQAGADTETAFGPAIEPEASGELARLLRKTPLSPDLIDGYLTSILVAPNFVTPTEWLPPLLGGMEVPGDHKLQRILDILMLRFGSLQDTLYEENIAAQIQGRSSQKLADWLRGFEQASRIAAAWPKRALSRDDKKIISLMQETTRDDQVLATLKPLLPGWLKTMAEKALNT